MVYGPHAVARHEGKVVFVRGAAPCEEVEVVIREDRGRYAYADLLDVIRPSPVRRTPPCPYLPACGGCPWQHLEYEAQLAIKRVIVSEQLRRIGRLELDVPPVMSSPLEFGYRQRLKLRVADREVGFFAGGTHSLVAVERCLLPEPPVAAAIPEARVLIGSLHAKVRRLEIAAARDSTPDLTVAAEVEGSVSCADEPVCRSWLDAHPQVSGLTLAGRRWRRTWGSDRIAVRPQHDLSLNLRIGGFSQVNPRANRRLVEMVLDIVNARPGLRVLDLYSGAGNFSLPLARKGADVLAVEQDRKAVEDGNENARRLGLPACRFEQGRAARKAAELADAKRSFDLVLLDPPRCGAAETLTAIMRLAPPRLLYVSCDPSTLARDLRHLAARYRVRQIQAIDMFPHTYHVETIVETSLI